MVAEAFIAVSPDADVQAGGRHTPLREAHHADRFTADGVLDSDLVGLELRPESSYRDVPAAVDDEPGVTPEAVRHGVRAKALAGPSRVDHQAGRTDDHARLLIDRDRSPQSLRMRSGGTARRRVGQCLL